MLNIIGTIRVKGAEQQVSDKFRKREFVLTDNSTQYPQHISFQLTQDRCGLIEQFKEGDTVNVFFNLRGREWKSPQNEIRYFNTLEAWKIEMANAAQNAPVSSSPTTSASPAAERNQAVKVETISSSTEEDDLPF